MIHSVELNPFMFFFFSSFFWGGVTEGNHGEHQASPHNDNVAHIKFDEDDVQTRQTHPLI